MSTRRRRVTPAPVVNPPLVLDSGAVLALAVDDASARAVLAVAVRRGAPVLVPAPVVTETVRDGGRDAPVNRVLRAVGEVVSVDEQLARTAGVLLGSTGSKAGAVDALVIATAAVRGAAVVLTSDPVDLRRLGRDHPEVVIRKV